jgi:hypothetical protein
MNLVTQKMGMNEWRAGYDPTDRQGAQAFVQESAQAGEIATGLLYLDKIRPKSP